ncbi:uncharacterized protein LOC118470288 [Amphiprion ocellaris]|uniref:uncharacterized protein LOC118470288 n=1 Tax=Amphiprion ocellaris TaxID=80972 RepID=UPI00241129BD|nr:uncharacterized protein LOC118470288 [Amphiprion ocellaris]
MFFSKTLPQCCPMLCHNTTVQHWENLFRILGHNDFTMHLAKDRTLQNFVRMLVEQRNNNNPVGSVTDWAKPRVMNISKSPRRLWGLSSHWLKPLGWLVRNSWTNRSHPKKVYIAMNAGHQDKSYLLDHYDHNRDKDHSYLQHIGFQGFSSSTTMMKLLSVAIVVGLVLDNSLKVLSVMPPPDDERRCWTEWFDRDDPSGSGDWETLSDLRKENPGMICRNPFAIDVQSLDGESGDVFYRNDPKTGFVCRNKDQPGRKMCSDYRVRFLCKPPFCVGGFV